MINVDSDEIGPRLGCGGVEMGPLEANRPYDSRSSHTDITLRHSCSLTYVYSIDAWIAVEGSPDFQPHVTLHES